MHLDDEFVETENVLIDVIKVDDIPAIEELGNPPAGWTTDALRCEEHFADAINLPTDGYAEALVIADLTEPSTPGTSGMVIDAADLQVLAYSASDHGANPPRVSAELLRRALTRNDYGFCRIRRQKELLTVYRDWDDEPFVSEIENAVERARKIT